MNEPLRGIGLNLIAGIIFRAADTIARNLAIVQITWTRHVVFVLMALLLTTRTGGADARN